MRDLPLIAFSLRPAWIVARAATGSPGSRARNFSAYLGSLTPPSRVRTRASARTRMAFPPLRQDRHSDLRHFGAQYPAYGYPSPTLQVRPRDRPRMAGGQGGSLRLPCTTLPFATPCRFIPALFEASAFSPPGSQVGATCP